MSMKKQRNVVFTDVEDTLADPTLLVTIMVPLSSTVIDLEAPSPAAQFPTQSRGGLSIFYSYLVRFPCLDKAPPFSSKMLLGPVPSHSFRMEAQLLYLFYRLACTVTRCALVSLVCHDGANSLVKHCGHLIRKTIS